MLDSFWNSLELDDPAELQYVVFIEYDDEATYNSVKSKLDHVLLKLAPRKELMAMDYSIVSNIHKQILTRSWSLTEKGIEYLNSIIIELGY